MHVCAYILAVDVAPLPPIPRPPRLRRGSCLHAEVKNPPLSPRTRRGAKRFNFRCPRCTDDVTIFIKRDQTDTRKKKPENAWEILILSSRFSKPSRMFRAPTARFSRYQTKKIHAVSQEERRNALSARCNEFHTGRVTSMVSVLDTFCAKVWMELDKRGMEREGVKELAP